MLVVGYNMPMAIRLNSRVGLSRAPAGKIENVGVKTGPQSASTQKGILNLGSKKLKKKEPRRFGGVAKIPTNDDPSGVMAGSNHAAKEITGIFFWLLLGLAVAKDGLDVVFNLVELLGLGVSATLVGIVVGMPLFVLFTIIGIVLTLAIFFTNMIYFVLSASIATQAEVMRLQNSASAQERSAGSRSQKVSPEARIQAKKIVDDAVKNVINRAKNIFIKRLVILSVTAIIGIIPVLDILPESIMGVALSAVIGMSMNKKTKKGE